ncbi:MAG: glutamate synthase [Clostridia bacterium]|nr:glutamate synthase [Clostridia bacterium]
MIIDAERLGNREINEILRGREKRYTLRGCTGQRFIAAGMSDKEITIEGIPGNALGAYLNGARITVKGNAQDAVGDTMNDGEIVIHGSIGDAAGYAMRGGAVFVRDSAGYRAGIHMKAYNDKIPVMVIGGYAGSFLGEYQAGGVIVVLGLHAGTKRIVGNFPCTGMHGGKMILRSDCEEVRFPEQVHARSASEEDREEIRRFVSAYCARFGEQEEDIMDAPFTVVTPNSKNPYKQLYVAN